jgi:hypothetical protein
MDWRHIEDGIRQCKSGVRIRVARFFLAQHTKTGKNVPKRPQKSQNTPNASKIYQMAKIYKNVFHLKAVQNVSKLGFFGFQNVPSGNTGQDLRWSLEQLNPTEIMYLEITK